ncbi:Zinc finger CCCH domain-containing protein 3 [Phytophthora ramorum]|uniref:Zinc finger CCCH domain-containing protein 3 n=1 Tax=Phytophthora ramorum TaxID=164328 RepID=UPI0030B6D5A6|nr:Zinc finger CCCH domain-containing protein 3 [Phytophthora ramorum]
MEEATLRAKIQAMKNLLEAKRQGGSGAAPATAGYAQSRAYARPPVNANRSWTRFPSPANRSHASANKVWRREEAATAKSTLEAAVGKHKTWKRPVKVAAKSRQLQMLRLPDGEYSKVNGGFSLVRAGVQKPTVAAAASPAAVSMPVSHSNSNSVHIGGVKYVVANGGKVLKRCLTEERKTAVTYRPGSRSLVTKSGAARAALFRAKATIQRARSKRLHAAKKAAKVRTVYCSFYNRFGFCKNKDACRFIHDSRRVAMCRKFLKNECNDPKCLLSHQHDENKVPDCKMFLRGACTRENCRYRHVKVSATAALCEPFTGGYCPKGGACPLRHELPLINRKSAASASGKDTTTNASDHRQQAPDVLGKLSASVLLGNEDADSGREVPSTAVFGIRLEQLSLRVQREIWSALASGASPSEDAAVDLARAFLRVAAQPRGRESDAVCVSLARMMLTGEQKEIEATGADTVDAAFQRRMRRLTLSRVKFPSQVEVDEFVATGLHKTLSSSGTGSRSIQVTSSLLSKRSRADEVNDTEQDSRGEAAPTSAMPQERPPLSKQMEDRASTLAKQLALLSRADATAAMSDVATRAFSILAEVVNDIHTTYAANERSFQYLCQMLRMHSTSDEALHQITSALIDSNWSSRYAAIFLETSVLPKIRAADSVISRILLQTALRFGSSYTVALVDSLLLPLLVAGNADPGECFGPAQAEAITRILRSPDTVPADQLDGFIQKSLTIVSVGEESNARPHLLSNESALLVFQNILNTKPVLSPLTVERFVGACEAVLERPEGEQLRGSLKFATVVFTLISKYPQQCAGHLEILEAIAAQLTSIMAKTTLRSLQKLKTSK